MLQGPEPQGWGLPHFWPVAFSPTLSRLPGSLEQIGELLFGLRECRPTITLCGGGGPWSLGRGQIPNTRCWYAGGN